MLAGCGAAKTWDISVQDNEGHGVADVSAQVCSDTTCQMLTTDENGAIDFNGDEDSYEVHIYSVPDGYESFDKGVKNIVKPHTTKVTSVRRPFINLSKSEATDAVVSEQSASL